MTHEHTYIVSYDISDHRRWRHVFKTMKGYGEWLQLSVFQCRLSKRRLAELIHDLEELVRMGEDHVLLIDIGPADRSSASVHSLGKPFDPLERDPVVI